MSKESRCSNSKFWQRQSKSRTVYKTCWSTHLHLSILVSHGSFLKANGGELLCKVLNLTLQLSNLWRHIGLQICLEVLQLGTMLLLEVLTDLDSSADTYTDSKRHAQTPFRTLIVTQAVKQRAAPLDNSDDKRGHRRKGEELSLPSAAYRPVE